MRVRDFRPLQQGLRLVQQQAAHQNHNVRDHRPLQQGLRQKWIYIPMQMFKRVPDQRPQQQGLIQHITLLPSELGPVRDHRRKLRIMVICL